MSSSIHSVKLPNGDWMHNSIPERASSRHYWADILEVGGNRTVEHDGTPGPYTNWGFTNRLDFVLAQARERIAQ